MRPHIAAIYAFARTADDFADEPGDRRPRSGFACSTTGQRAPQRASAGPVDDPAVFVALAHTIRRAACRVSLFEDLLSAFKQDVTRSGTRPGRICWTTAGVRRTRSDGSCCASAATIDPRLDRRVGRGLHRAAADQLLAGSRARLGRTAGVYVPADERERAGAVEQDLDGGRMTPAWRQVMAGMIQRTRRAVREGRPVCDGVRGRLRWELRLTWLGGTRDSR